MMEFSVYRGHSRTRLICPRQFALSEGKLLLPQVIKEHVMDKANFVPSDI